jgi:hypothetical protein
MLYNILKNVELDCCQIIILNKLVPSTHAYTHVLCLSLDFPYKKSYHFDDLRSILWSGCGPVVYGARQKAK